MTDLAPVVAPSEPALDDSHLSHIVNAPGGKAEAIVLESRVLGIPVTALCGYRWVPSRDPQRHPVCQACLSVLALLKSMEGWSS